MEQKAQINSELQRLNVLVGKWFSEGEMIETATNPQTEIKAIDNYEWTCGENFLIHRVDGLIGAEKLELIEIIGFDVQNQAYSMRSFDNHGNCGLMYMAISAEGIFKVTGDLIRSTLLTSENGKDMTAQWEKSMDGAIWELWMDMKFTKAL